MNGRDGDTSAAAADKLPARGRNLCRVRVDDDDGANETFTNANRRVNAAVMLMCGRVAVDRNTCS